MSESSLSPVTVARSTLVVVVVLTACATAYTARGAVVLVFFGAFVAVAVEPVVAALVRRGWKRGSAVGLLLLGGVVLLVLLVLLLLVPASQQLGSLVADLPARLAAMSDHLGGEATSSGSYVGTASTQETWADAIRHTTALVSAAAAGIFGLAGAVLGAGLTAFSITALAVYFSMAMPRVRGGLEGALRTEGRIAAVEESLAKISGYVIGQFLICVVAGVCAFGFFALAGVPYPALLALVVLALDAIPQVGATLASLAGIAVALTVSVPTRHRHPCLLPGLPAGGELPGGTAGVLAHDPDLPAGGLHRGFGGRSGRGRVGRRPGPAHRGRGCRRSPPDPRRGSAGNGTGDGAGGVGFMTRVLRSGLTAAALVLLYAVAPVGTVHRSFVAWMLFAAGLGTLVLLLISLIRHHRVDPRGSVRIEWVVLVAYAVIAFFALVYVDLAQRPGQFVGLDDRVDALYFTVSTLATVGYGDVHPVGAAARVVVTAQMFFDLTLLAGAARVVGSNLWRGGAARSPTPGEVTTGSAAEVGGDGPPPGQNV